MHPVSNGLQSRMRASERSQKQENQNGHRQRSVDLDATLWGKKYEKRKLRQIHDGQDDTQRIAIHKRRRLQIVKKKRTEFDEENSTTDSIVPRIQ